MRKKNEKLQLKNLELKKKIEELEKRGNATSVSSTDGKERTAVVDGLPSTPTTAMENSSIIDIIFIYHV